MSVRHIVQQTQQTLQFPVREKDYPCEHTVIKAEASENATRNNQERQQNINRIVTLHVR